MSSVSPVPMTGLAHVAGSAGGEDGRGPSPVLTRFSDATRGAKRRPDRWSNSAPVVIAGAVGTEPGALLEALVTDQDATMVDSVTVNATPRRVPRGGLAAVVAGPALAVFRNGPSTRAKAFLPGRGKPTVIDLGFLGALGKLPRPPRRLEIEHPSELLRAVRLAGAPELTDLDPAGFEVVSDVVERAAGLVFVTGSAPFEQCHLELFDALASRASRLAFVVSPGSGPAPVLAAKRASLIAHDPALAAAPWYSATDWVDIRKLRSLLMGWGATRAASRSLILVPGQRIGCRVAPPVAEDCADWRQKLEYAIASRRQAAGKAATNDLSGTLARCSRLLSSSTRGDVVPRMLDRELHALSVRVTRRLEQDAAATAREVCATLIADQPDSALVDRVLASVRQAIESFEDAAVPRGLLLTMTGAVATMTGRSALGSTAALAEPCPAAAGLPPVVVAVSQTCFRETRWSSDSGAEHCLLWLRRALTAVGGAILHDLDARYADLRRGMELVAEEAVDHGFLLV